MKLNLSSRVKKQTARLSDSDVSKSESERLRQREIERERERLPPTHSNASHSFVVNQAHDRIAAWVNCILLTLY